ncbi:MAG TPA: GNAT family N-acetyltransferase [Solirubrobacter sp.]|nr:GNAT family N-acetyltransferase [Solirubrobacter sp.]
MPVLTDGVITLRPPSHDDIDAIYEACQDPEIQTWTNVPSPYAREHAVDYVERVSKLPGTEAFLGFEDDRLVGSFSVMEIDRERAYAEIGYWVAAPARGRGLATRAVTLLRDWAAEELGARLIELIIHEDNLPSKRVAERTGFLCTGERRPAPRKEELGPENHDVYAWSPE